MEEHNLICKECEELRELQCPPHTPVMNLLQVIAVQESWRPSVRYYVAVVVNLAPPYRISYLLITSKQYREIYLFSSIAPLFKSMSHEMPSEHEKLLVRPVRDSVVRQINLQ